MLDILAGKAHSRTGPVMDAFAKLLTRYREMLEEELSEDTSR